MFFLLRTDLNSIGVRQRFVPFRVPYHADVHHSHRFVLHQDLEALSKVKTEATIPLVMFSQEHDVLSVIFERHNVSLQLKTETMDNKGLVLLLHQMIKASLDLSNAGVHTWFVPS